MELKALRISEKKAEVLHSMQIMRAEDLLTCYPFRYEHLEAKPRYMGKGRQDHLRGGYCEPGKGDPFQGKTECYPL